jgi:hypothetical protein
LQILLLALAMVLFSLSPSLAQMTPLVPTGPGMGATSPLGIPGASAVGPVGVPLGSTELTPGGLSPAPSDPAMTDAYCSGAGTATMGSYDGGGISTDTMGNCGTTTSAPGTTSPSLGASASSSGPTPGSTSIPLGASELDDAGTSPQ